MPWRKSGIMDLRKEFIGLTKQPGESFSEVCRRFGISRKTGYKWKNRFMKEGESGLLDLSRCPHSSPQKIPRESEATIVGERCKRSYWGARKIKRIIEKRTGKRLASVSTVHSVLRRNGLVNARQKNETVGRFQRLEPNDLWQMDFKGDVPARDGRCYPLTAVDDFSRYSIVLQACPNQGHDTVKDRLMNAFRMYGLPRQMLFDNGPPWGDDLIDRHTRLTVWLMRLGIHVIHSRPRHPQTLGKDERFHRTLKAELLGSFLPWTLAQSQERFDRWRHEYNHIRPHEALDLQVPASRYLISPRRYPDQLPELQFAPADIIRKVSDGGRISFQGKRIRVSKAFTHQWIAIRPNHDKDGSFGLYFANHLIRSFDLSKADQNEI